MGKRNSPQTGKAVGLKVGDWIGLVKTKPSPDYYPIFMRVSGRWKEGRDQRHSPLDRQALSERVGPSRETEAGFAEEQPAEGYYFTLPRMIIPTLMRTMAANPRTISR
jgi:hypothetical protein